MDEVRFCCPKCDSNKAYPTKSGMMRCLHCKFEAVHSSFKLEKRPSLKWDEAVERWPDKEEG